MSGRCREEAGIEMLEAAPRIAEPDLLDATIATRYARGLALALPADGVGRIGVIW